MGPALCIAVLSPVAKVHAAELNVEITGLRSDLGDVHVALYDDPQSFPDGDGMLVEREIVVGGDSAVVLFSGLAAKPYAIAVYHDENGNDSFDQGLFGIPLEDYGFSNGAIAFFGPPSFADAAFTVTEPELRVRIDLGN